MMGSGRAGIARRLALASACAVGLATAAGAAQAPAALFVFDASGSMWGRLEGQSKIEMARSVMSDVVHALPAGIDVGLLTYGHRRRGDCEDIEVVAPIGTGRASIVELIRAIDPKGSTPLTRAVEVAAAQLREREAPASIIVVSDGEESCGGDPCAASRAARRAGIDLRIHVVGFDVGDEEAEQLRCIAEAGGGRYWAAGGAVELAQALQDVRQTVESELAAPERTAAKAAGLHFEDVFGRTALGPDWRMLHEDPDRWIVDQGLLVVTQSYKKITDAQGAEQVVVPNTLELVRPLPDDFEVTVEWEVDFQLGPYWGQQITAAVVSGKGNALEAGFRYGDFGSAGYDFYLGRYTAKRVGGKADEVVDKGPKVGKGLGLQTVRVRIVKRKFDVTAYGQATGEAEWREIGRHKVLRFPEPRLRLSHVNWGRAGAPESEARIRRVTIRAVK